ncbi:MAG: methyltransferase dimerization domain-containing protein [Planctomycetota bacterium]
MEKGLDYLNALTWGYRASRALQVGVQFKLFTCLARKSMTCEVLAAACGASSEPLEKLLIACCAMGLLEKDGDVYRNSELANRYLIEGGHLYQGHIIAHAANVWDYWGDLANVIVGKPGYGGPMPDHKNFILGMQDITRGGRGQLFLDTIDLTGRKKLFDVGGGPGT